MLSKSDSAMLMFPFDRYSRLSISTTRRFPFSRSLIAFFFSSPESTAFRLKPVAFSKRTSRSESCPICLASINTDMSFDPYPCNCSDSHISSIVFPDPSSPVILPKRYLFTRNRLIFSFSLAQSAIYSDAGSMTPVSKGFCLNPNSLIQSRTSSLSIFFLNCGLNEGILSCQFSLPRRRGNRGSSRGSGSQEKRINAIDFLEGSLFINVLGCLDVGAKSSQCSGYHRVRTWYLYL